jgi:outer membrane protein TolC
MRSTLVYRLSAAAIVVFVLLAGGACVHNPPKLEGEASTAPSPSTFWTPPEDLRQPAPETPKAAVPQELAAAQQHWSLVDVVDLALRNNNATKVSWAEARAAAARYGSVRGSYWPTLQVDADWVRAKATSSPTSPYLPVPITTVGAAATVNYLLFDFGGREASVEASRQALIAADFGHNAVIQQVVFEVEAAYFRYMAAKALLLAQEANLKDAQTQLEAADERHAVGVATIADVLQAKTALSRARLALQATQGAIQSTRGALATAMGLPADTPYDIVEVPRDLEVEPVKQAVQSLIDLALTKRPDLAASRAEGEKAAAHVKEVQARLWPSLTASGSVARTYYEGYGVNADSYAAGVYLRIPIFTGFSMSYDVLEAKSQAEAAQARTKGLQQQVIFQVWDSYYAHQTATLKVATTADLLTSATQSREVALARYREGVGTLLDLMAADAALADARSQRIGAWFEYFTSLAQLARDTGLLGLHAENPLVALQPVPTSDQPVEVKP